MRLDGHTHIFTLYTILSREAIRVIEQRLRDRLKGTGVPDALVEAVGQLLHDQLNQPEYLDERRLLKALLEKLTGIDSIDRLLRNLPVDHSIRVDIEGDLDNLAVPVLREHIGSVLSREGGPLDKVLDIVDTLRLSMQPTVTDVADDLLKEMDGDGVLVALMMDIYGEGEVPEDRHRYLRQINGHAEAALQRPGRVLNFFGVHPDRMDTLEQLRRAVETKGFVGVKLYPSLSPVDTGSPHGHSVNSDKMKEVYRYCIAKELPVLLHCSHGGFYRTEDAIDHCNPKHWDPVLSDPDFSELRVCFAHFGGHEALTEGRCFQDPDDDNWGAQILRFIKNNPNIYTDLAKHVAMFDEPTKKQAYFDNMGKVIAHVGDRLIFGTDAWLLRLDMPYKKYWAQWKQASGNLWDSITIAGPRAFLGFHGDDPKDWTENLRSFVQYMADHRHSVGQPAADWLAAAVRKEFVSDRDPPSWNRHKQAVRDTYQFLGSYLTASQKDRGFAQNSELRLHDLTYYDSGDPNFAGNCRDMARRFVDFADQRLGYRGGHDFSSTVDRFIGIFGIGDLTLREVAMTIDSIVAYPDSIS